MKKISSIIFLTIAVINLARLLCILSVKGISLAWVAIAVADIALGGWCIYDIAKDGKGDNDGNKSKSSQ